nr:reverse transcriptase domain-containing protein [Tanacetum cinerariifolium]
KNDKSSIDEPPEVELKDLPPHLEYTFLEGDDKFPVIIAKDLSIEEKAALIKVLKSHKQVIAWKLSDIKGINPEFCTHKILIEDDFEPAVQHQRRVNPKIHKVIKKEVLKLLDARLIYPVSDSPWVSLVHCVPKKGGFTVFENEENELIPTRLVTRWRVCIDYCKLNESTRKYYFPLPFMDQILERLAGNEYYCFLDGFSGYFQIPIDPKDQAKTTYTCPYGMLPTITCLSGCVMHRARSKEKTKRIHDSKIKDRVFNVGGRVLLFNSRLKIFSGKLKTRWSGPFNITQVFPYGTAELSQTDMTNFKVNGHRLKHYFGEDIPKMVVLDLQTFPKDQ